jgi:hypothetical protein
MSIIETNDDRTMTVREFCDVESISLASYFAMRRRGYGPAEIRVPGTRIIRITQQARREWHERLAAIAQTEAARLEAERRRAQTVIAGNAAAASPLHVSKLGKRTAPARQRRASAR